MTAPTKATRQDMYERDLDRCAACGRTDRLTHQHRRAVGMGGSKTPPSITDSLTLCFECNWRAEHDLQTFALIYGWKVRRWVQDPSAVPVFYAHSIGWARLTDGGAALPIHADEAAEMMREVYGEEWDEWREQVGAVAPVRR
ncbi:hypothetical protein Leucomu_13025 [Leucobacter muris]|uniref:HNH endonuclease n=1 Tax=Leucobacter muris TaxID=1935379 RepID=A0ABX5QHZ0_9MICO|nr:hypothetical protein [Leucobacter muris]QAB18709.1 hypothetical protein Leucomu_13025 [Leucobacter muris]